MTGFGHEDAQGPVLARRSVESMDNPDAAFEACWKELRPGLVRVLRARGATEDVVDDVLQETSIRLLKVWERLDRARPLAPLARTIAVNYLIDFHRASRLVPVEELPDGPSGYDLEEHAFARARLARAEAALDSLATADRTALLAEVGLGERANTSAAKMARLRARKRLTAAMDRVAAAFGGVQLGWRRAGLWFQQLNPSGEALLPVMASAAGVVTVAMLGMSSGPSGLSAPKVERLEHVRVVSQERLDRHDQEEGRTAAHGKPVADRDRKDDAVAVAETRSPTPKASPSESTVVDAGNAKANTREGRGYKGVEVCTGDSTEEEADDHSASVTVDLGEGDDPGESCS